MRDRAARARAAGAGSRRSTRELAAQDRRARRALVVHRARPTSRPCSSRAASSGSLEIAPAASTWRPTGEPRPYLEPRGGRGAADPPRLAHRRRAASRSRATSSHTYNFLRKIPWGRRFADVPRIAGAHHEKLDGTGYPRRLRGRRHPDPVAHDDHRRHLRRAHGVGPPVQEGGAGRARARHPRERGQGAASATPSCSASSSRPRSTSRSCSVPVDDAGARAGARRAVAAEVRRRVAAPACGRRCARSGGRGPRRRWCSPTTTRSAR